MSSLVYSLPTLSDMRARVQDVFEKRACLFQLRAGRAILERRDTILIAPTGVGKTLAFWMPLVFNNGGILLVITALNILGAQNQLELEAAGITAKAVTAENATDELYKVSTFSSRMPVAHDLFRSLRQLSVA
jgi:superfamily II DNA helicase RecQ